MVEEIEFKGEHVDPGAIPYEPYTPQMVKMITQGGCKPPLCKVGDGLSDSPVYEVGSMELRAYLRFVSVDGSWDIETPLAMCRYVKPEGDMLFNITACEDATRENARRRLHNKFVVDVMREFMPRFDCGASANRMTEPQAPPDFVLERLDKVKELKKDKLGTTQKAIEYLARFERYCGRDYKFEESFEKASDACFEETVRQRVAKGKIRVRLEGRKPCWWDGTSKEDESGCRVKWERGDGHTFLTPDIRVVRDDSPITPEPEGELVVAGPDSDGVNPFAALFSASASAPAKAIEEEKIPLGECRIRIEEAD